MWFVSTVSLINLLSVVATVVLANGNGWGSPNSNSQASAPSQQRQDYWWKDAFQKPANHPGIEKGDDNNNYVQSSGGGGGGQGWGAPAAAPARPVQSNYNRPSPQPVHSYNPPPQQQQRQPAPVIQSYNPPPAPTQSYNPPPQQIQPVPAPAPSQPYQGYQPPSPPVLTIVVDPNCMLTSKVDCHSPPIQSPNSYPDNSASSYNQPKPIDPAQQVQIPVQSGGSYSGSSDTVYSPQPIPTPQTNQIPQSPPVPAPYNPPAASNYNSNSYGISVPTSPVQTQPQPLKPSYNSPPTSSQYQPSPQIPSQQQPSTNYVQNKPPTYAEPSVNAVSYQPTAPINNNYNKPQNNVGYNPNTQYQQPPRQNNYQTPSNQNNNNNYPEQPPYPGCPAALLCVTEDLCNAEGKIEEQPVQLTEAEKVYRVALMACSAPKTGVVGVCCRDPNYKDPWPNMNGGGGGQHHHHHDGDKGGNSGQFNNGQYTPQQHSQPQQPSNNFNSYSGR